MNQKNTYTFSGLLQTVAFSFVKTAVFIPREITVSLPRGRKKVAGLMNGAPFSLSVQSRKDGTQFFSVSSALREAAAIRPGDPVKVIFSLLDNGHGIPAILETRLTSDDDAGRVWNGFTAGLQNGLPHYVNTAKKLDCRIRKSFEWVERSTATAIMEPLKKRKTKN
jgi:hypothetical protein